MHSEFENNKGAFDENLNIHGFKKLPISTKNYNVKFKYRKVLPLFFSMTHKRERAHTVFVYKNVAHIRHGCALETEW